MSDTEFPPPKNHLPSHFDLNDFRLKENEPACVNSLCNLINTRLKLLENEIVTQHKVWEYIQKEVDEVKSLVEDCTSTCDSSSFSGHESDVFDSALESHKTCNNLLWDKIRKAENNLEQKKSSLKILSSKVLKLKDTKKRCNRKHHVKVNSNIDLILEVTNGLHVLRCGECKFCSEHVDFRESLLSSVIELIHFSENSYKNSLEENKSLKLCLQKIYLKTKQCLLRSQTYVKNAQFSTQSVEFESNKFCTDNIYYSFEEFCHYFQSLQEELMQLKHILLAAEENHLDEVFQSSHSSDCLCYSFSKKQELALEKDYKTDETKLSKSYEDNTCYYEKTPKLRGSDELENMDPDVIFDESHEFELISNHGEKQLEDLRSRIFEAVKLVRDVELEGNDDENLINMVTSLAEECSALRQEVSYLRNVRQEKKRAWNKLQCFIMDAERKLKGNSRSIPCLREVIRDLGQVISTSESSSLDETLLYMYSNQLDWVERFSMGYENPSSMTMPGNYISLGSVNTAPTYKSDSIISITASTQTSLDFKCDYIVHENDFFLKQHTSEIGIQTDVIFTCSMGKAETFKEISREIYVVPELEELDSCSNDGLQQKDIESISTTSESCNNCSDFEMTFSCNRQNSYQHSSHCVSKANLALTNIFDKTSFKNFNNVDVNDLNNYLTFESDCSSECQNLYSYNKNDNIIELDLITVFPLHGSFLVNLPTKITQMPVHNSKQKCHLLKINNISSVFQEKNYPPLLSKEISNTLNYLSNDQSLLSIFLNTNNNVTHLFSVKFLSVFKNNFSSIEIDEKKYNRSFMLENSNEFLSTFVNSKKSLQYSSDDLSQCIENSKSNALCKFKSKNINENDDKTISNIKSYFPLSSSISNEVNEELPKYYENETSINDTQCSNLSTAEVINKSIVCYDCKDQCGETDNQYSIGDVEKVSFSREGTFVIEKPVSACREGTFIIDSGENLSLNKSKIHENQLYCSIVLSAFVSKESNKTEKNYILYEVDSSVADTMLNQSDLNQISTFFEDVHISNQHFILCETAADKDSMMPESVVTNTYCHVILLKPDNKVAFFSEDTSDSTSFCSPLFPQYLPTGSSKFESLKQFSLAQSCEIYMFNRNKHNMENELLIPKNYFKFKNSFSDKNEDSQENFLCETVLKENLIQKSPKSFKENCDVNFIMEEDERYRQFSSTYNDNKSSFHLEIGIQTDESIFIHENVFSEKVLNTLEEEEAALEEEEAIVDFEANYGSVNYSPSYDLILKEKTFLDEIKALKDNLAQQNAVLVRLKEDLEESNFRLAEKEQILVILQLELSRLNSMLTETGVKEVDEKECQTDKSFNFNTQALESEIDVLRLKNLRHHEHIVQQNSTIQSVKSQLCATISNLRLLKDAATKQLKKQKHIILKSVKFKQQLHETKLDLEKKCQELEKEKKVVSDQEFCLHEMQVHLDATLKQLSENTKTINVVSTDIKKIDIGCQADVNAKQSCEESKMCLKSFEDNITLKKHSEELLKLQAKFQYLESILSNRREYKTKCNDAMDKTNNEMKIASESKDGNLWKLLAISEQSYLGLLNKLAESLQLSDLKGTSALMHSTWFSCDDLASARRHDHKKILQSLEKMKKNIRFLQESLNIESKRQRDGNVPLEEPKSNLMNHSEELHFQYLCDILQKAQENLVKEYSQKSQRTVITAGSGRTSRHTESRERRIPLELKNGKILAMLDDKLNHKELLPSKFDCNKMDCKVVSPKSKLRSR